MVNDTYASLPADSKICAFQQFCDFDFQLRRKVSPLQRKRDIGAQKSDFGTGIISVAVKADAVPGFAISQPAVTPSLARPAQDLASPKILNASRDLVVGQKPAAQPDTSAPAKPEEKAKANEPSKADAAKAAAAAPQPTGRVPARKPERDVTVEEEKKKAEEEARKR